MAQIFKKIIFNLQVPSEIISAPLCAIRHILTKEQQGLAAAQGKVSQEQKVTPARTMPSPTKGTVPQGLKHGSRAGCLQRGASIAPDAASNEPGPGSLQEVQPGGVKGTGTSYSTQPQESIQKSILDHIYLDHRSESPQKARPKAGLKTNTPTINSEGA